MRLIHNVPFSSQEIETFRQSIFSNLTLGMKYMLEAMDDITLKLSEDNMDHMSLIENAADLRDEEPFPMSYLEPLRSLWNDPKVQEMWRRRNESALPEKYFSP
jgi:guanine nucleotide-binding protein subunit alpha